MNIVVTVKQVADPNIPPSHVQLIAAWKTHDLAVALPAPRVTLRKLAIQTRVGKAEMIVGESGAEQGAALANKLREQGLI